MGPVVDDPSNSNVDLFDATGHTEDLGLNELPSRRDLVEAGGSLTPSQKATSAASPSSSVLSPSPENSGLGSPAADDYHHFREQRYFSDNGLFPGGASAQERYAHYYAGVELNNDVARRAILPDRENGISQIPSTEDVNNNYSSTKASEEQFFRYTLPLDAAGLQASPYFTGSTIETNGATWYLIRISVRSEEREDQGGNLSNVEMVRLWTTGHLQPATLRSQRSSS